VAATVYRPEKFISQRILILIEKLCLEGHFKFKKIGFIGVKKNLVANMP